MTQTLPQVGHQHHAHILEMTNRFPEIADALLVDHGRGATAELQRVREFLQGTLVPHLEAAEATIYPELERMLQNRHSMTPMRREHHELRRLISGYSGLVEQTRGETVSIDRALALRRLLFGMYALLKVHLAEEEEYLRIVEHGVSEDAAAILAAALEHPVK
jgi:hypothetical protein